jgi:hypothetical protein
MRFVANLVNAGRNPGPYGDRTRYCHLKQRAKFINRKQIVGSSFSGFHLGPVWTLHKPPRVVVRVVVKLWPARGRVLSGWSAALLVQALARGPSAELVNRSADYARAERP